MTRCRRPMRWRWWGLATRAHHFPAQLSGGDSNALPLRAPLPNARMCCCVTNPRARSTWATGIRVLETLVTANRDLGTTTLLITHNADIAQIGDRVVRFADGAIRSIEINTERCAPGDLHW